jgi:hypothetical protein
MSHPLVLTTSHDDDDNWMGLMAGVTSSLTLTSGSATSPTLSTLDTGSPASTSTSGKFNSFAFAGAAVSGGWGSKRTLVAMFPKSKFDRLCLGLVGTTKFCIKEHLPGTQSCGTGKHESSKFSTMEDSFFSSTRFRLIVSHVLSLHPSMKINETC